ncbi:MAG: Acyl-CoA dehydrogenase, short-chain specific [Microbacteriaceae bacterium]|nr:Acyl-CoA dehydrogenase, short-chain specific [Microbacteriaceae bacterium]
MTPDETKELRSTITALLESPAGEIPAQLDELGWEDLVAEEEEAAITALFSEHGRVLGTSTILDGVLISALGVAADAVIYNAVESGGTITGILVATAPEGDAVFAVPGLRTIASVPAGGLTVSPLPNFDEDLSWSKVSFAAASAVSSSDADWEAAEAAGQRALAAEIIGIARETLRLVMAYTSDRFQYGHPIATFQSVRFRYSDAHSANEAAAGLLHAAFSTDDVRASRAAKALAGRAAQLSAQHSIQTFGAIGSTKEHVLHHYVARGAVLDSLLGSSRDLTSQIGAEILESGFAPILTEL